jgi:anthranilate synthase/aminodeoxychorismate synthase-like glutamine amidotransferase
VFGAEIVGAKRLMHGKTSWIFHDGKGIYRGIKNPFVATRYHSLIVKRDSIPNELVVSAWTEDDEVMGIRHKYLPLDGVQYHPESILTKEGKRILRNFLEAAHQNIKAHHEERG